MKLLIKFSIFFLSLNFLYADVINFDTLVNMPKSMAKDYYIYRYITEAKPTKSQVIKLKDEITRYSGKIKSKVESIIGTSNPQAECLGINLTNVADANSTCKQAIITVNFLNSITKQQRENLATSIKDNAPNLSNFIYGFDQEDPAKYFIQTNDYTSWLKLYNASANKDEFLSSNILTNKFLNLIIKNAQFQHLIKDAIISKKYDKFRSSLLDVNYISLPYDIAFILGINAILFDREADALKFFQIAANSSKFASNKDNALFWIFLITRDVRLLKIIANSKDINIYSLYAKELTNGGKIKIIVPNPKNETLKGYDYTNPFEWQKVLKQISKMNNYELSRYGAKFFTKSTLGEYSYIMEKAYNYSVHIYPTPFMKYIGTQDINRQALILSLARQESRFVPSAISTSYALGMLQFMPFLANAIGKKELKLSKFDQDDMFKPQIAYKFANLHLDYLEKYLTNPIFIAYAYNGGIGFTRRMIQKGDLFNKDSRYERFEPFLSMELVPYAESRLYGKKVLANYIIYLTILNSSTRISQFFENLMIPGAGEKFR